MWQINENNRFISLFLFFFIFIAFLYLQDSVAHFFFSLFVANEIRFELDALCHVLYWINFCIAEIFSQQNFSHWAFVFPSFTMNSWLYFFFTQAHLHYKKKYIEFFIPALQKKIIISYWYNKTHLSSVPKVCSQERVRFDGT